VPPLAIITMVYNEPDRLPYWLAHYAREVGLEHCYVIDHGSDDGSTADLRGASRLALPRTPQDNDRRTRFITDLARGLLLYYRRVAYVDADELLLADPAKYSDLADYAARMQSGAATSIGLEIVQGPDEPPLDLHRGVGEQRGSVLFSSSMCKTNMIGTSVNWAPGWHSHDGPPRFDDLYLFHLRHADLDQALRRLAITRDMPWANEHAGKHQRMDDEWMRGVVEGFGRLPLATGTSLTSPIGPLAKNMHDFIADSVPNSTPGLPYIVPLARYGRERIPLDADFRAALSATPL
jgi:hypothetical protein